MGQGINLRDQVAEIVKGERCLDEFAEAEVVVTLVEEQSRGTNERLLALGVSWFEELSLSHQHEPRCLGARQHNTRTP